MTDAHDDELGYAPAAGKTLAPTTICTPRTGLGIERATIDAPDGPLPIYAARPEGAPGAPVVLVICETFGLHEHIADIARRFAHEGYFAIAPDLMVRHGDPMGFADIGSLVEQLLLKIPDGEVMSDLDACADWAAARGGDTARLAATGFCWGGRWTWLYAAHRPLTAAVAWYGIVDGSAMFPDDPERFPTHPIDVAGELQTPVLGLYAGEDEAIPLGTVETMRSRLRDGSTEAKASEIVLYPDAGHAFFADYRDGYDAEAARDAWPRCLDWIGPRVRS